MQSNIQWYYPSFLYFLWKPFFPGSDTHPTPGRGHGSLTCHMTQFERSDWLRSENFTNIMIVGAALAGRLDSTRRLTWGAPSMKLNETASSRANISRTTSNKSIQFWTQMKKKHNLASISKNSTHTNKMPFSSSCKHGTSTRTYRRKKRMPN